MTRLEHRRGHVDRGARDRVLHVDNGGDHGVYFDVQSTVDLCGVHIQWATSAQPALDISTSSQACPTLTSADDSLLRVHRRRLRREHRVLGHVHSLGSPGARGVASQFGKRWHRVRWQRGGCKFCGHLLGMPRRVRREPVLYGVCAREPHLGPNSECHVLFQGDARFVRQPL